MNLLDQLTNMLEWEISLEKVEFRCESIADRYRLLFEKLLKPCIELMRSYAVANPLYSPGLHSSPDASSLLMAANASSSLSINEAAKQSRRAIRPLVKAISYMLVCVPFQRMFCDYSLAEFLTLTTLSVSSARLSAQVSLYTVYILVFLRPLSFYWFLWALYKIAYYKFITILMILRL